MFAKLFGDWMVTSSNHKGKSILKLRVVVKRKEHAHLTGNPGHFNDLFLRNVEFFFFFNTGVVHSLAKFTHDATYQPGPSGTKRNSLEIRMKTRSKVPAMVR